MNAFHQVALERHHKAVSNDAIAATWRCSPIQHLLCVEHKKLNGKHFVFRGNWALRKHLMRPLGERFMDDVELPGINGCACHLEYIFSLRGLPPGMVTPFGRMVSAHVTKLAKES